MERVACDFCGEQLTSPVYDLCDLLLGLPGEFSLVRCENCGLLYLNPRPSWDELRSHYPDQYHPFTGELEHERSLFVRLARRYGVARRCRAVTQRQRQGRLLDVGCSTGVFLNEMRQRGDWDLHGVEPVASAVTFARQHFGLKVFQGTLLDSAYPNAFFDVVTMWDVLEHVTSPSAHLCEIHRILKQGGWLIVKVPDPQCWEARLFGPFWIGYDAPRHLFGFPRRILVSKLIAQGFEIDSVRCLAGGFFTFTASLGFWLDAQGRKPLGKLFRDGSRSTAFRVLTAPVFSLLRRLGLGSSLTYSARKQESRGQKE